VTCASSRPRGPAGPRRLAPPNSPIAHFSPDLHAAFQHRPDPSRIADVVERIGVEQHQVSRLAGLERAARGFRAGRALWTNTLDADDPTELLRSQSVPRLEELIAIVDRYAA